jgi:hypothetical protein
MKRAILRGCVFCSAIIAGSSALCASVRAIGEAQLSTLAGGTANVPVWGTTSVFDDRPIRCFFCGCILMGDASRMRNLENTIRSDSITSQSFLNNEKITLGYNDQNGFGLLPDATQENRFPEADGSSADEHILLLLYSDDSGEGLRRELPPDDAALDRSCRNLLRSYKPKESEKGTSGEERAKHNRDLLPELKAIEPSSCDLILIYCGGGRVLFAPYSSAWLTADLVKPGGTGFVRAKPTLLISGAGTNPRPILPHSSTESDSASFWLKSPVGYRRNVATRFKGPRTEAYWESWYDNYERYLEWRRKSSSIVPEPSTGALLVLSCLTLIHANAHRRSSKRLRPDHGGNTELFRPSPPFRKPPSRLSREGPPGDSEELAFRVA